MVALILLWPVVRRLLPCTAVVPVLAEAAHEIEESHPQHGLTDSVSVETNKRAHWDGPGM
jgi:putative tricarboxylic transport membrane protein